MRDPGPLSEETRSPFLRVVLRSGREDRSPYRSRERALAALGLATLGAGGTAAAATNAAARTPGAGGAAAPVAAKGSILLVKWLGLAAIGGLLASGTAGSTPALRPTEAQVLSAAPPMARAVAPATLADPPPAGLELQPTPQEHRSLGPVAQAARPAASGDGARRDGVGQQLEALAEVRAAILAGQPGRALDLLAAFDKRHRASPLAEEESLLRIDALLDAGRNTEAAAMGQVFLVKYPGSAYVQHVQSRLKSP